MNLSRPRTIAGVSLVSHHALISPGDRWMLCLCGYQVRIFSCLTGQLHSVLEESADVSDRLTALVFNPVNPHSQIYTATIGGSIFLWDYEEGVLLKKTCSKFPLLGLYVPYRDRGLFLLQSHVEHRSSVGSVKDATNRPKDESCALFHLDLLDDISRKKGQIVCRSLSTDSNKIAFCPRGEYLASINHNALNIYFFKDEHFKKHLISRNLFTCIAAHPKEQCIATGDTQGRIILWKQFREIITVSKTVVHWHSTSVLDTVFSLEGSYMWSGGWESTLVQWSLNNTDQKDFVSRLGAAIVRLSMSYDGHVLAVSHSDSVIHLVGLQRNILQTIKSISLTAADLPSNYRSEQTDGVFCVDPISRCLVLRGKPGSLQFYNPSKDRLESEIDVVGQNIISSGLKNFTNGVVDSAVFSSSGLWLCTADSLVTQHIGSTINLKFWARDPASSKYVLKTTVIDPHNAAPIRQMILNGRGSFLATLSDGDFKLWMIIKQKTLTGTEDVWYCVGVGDFKEYRPTVAVFSADDKTIAVAFQHLVTFWNVETSSLLDHALSHRRNTEHIRSMWYGSSSDTFHTATKSSVNVWSLSKHSILHTIHTEANCFGRFESMIALCGFRSVSVSEEQSLNEPVYTHSLPETSSSIISCCFMKKMAEDNETPSSGNSPSWLDRYSLFLLMANGEILIVDGKQSGQLANKLYTPDPQATVFYRHLQVVADPQTEEMNSLHVKPAAKNAQELIDKLIDTPAHTLAPSRYFLEEHLNILLMGSDAHLGQSDQTGVHMDVDEAKGDRATDHDDVEMKIEEPSRNRSTDSDLPDESSSASDRSIKLPTITDFKFLASHSASTEGRIKVSRAKNELMSSAFFAMSALYQSLREN